ncbi:tyrosine-type recombinase/integrase [Nocardia bovistercoris]|uniref:Site-specific integrase n=1 Tax=Nocardia bovistercoris TaxID=2785916 RepID=A0A931IJA0_9NOCA|nr:site-specific integrase [Nocardia bovistercoris]MBH0781351.1 site-specific integrase [Nocardia bovistercoris]
MAQGSVYRRCGCTTVDDNGKRVQLGPKCPKLKRPNGTWADHGTWGFTIGVVGMGGARSQVRRAGFATKNDAVSAMDDVKARASKGVVVNEKMTVGQYLNEWIDGKDDIKANTHANYSRYIEKVFVPHLGHVRLRDLRSAHIKAMFDDHTHLAPSSAQRMRAVLRSALSDALRAGLVTVNAAALVKMAGGRSPRALVWTKARESSWRWDVAALVEDGKTVAAARRSAPRPSSSMVWTPAHLGAFLDAMADHPLYALFWIASHCGLRRGEVCGLKWSDLDDGVITVERQLVCTPDGIIEDTPKSDASGRSVSVGTAGVKLLTAHRSDQRAELLSWGVGKGSGYMFTTPTGETLDPHWVSKEFKRQVTAADLPPIRFHDLRHTAASLMLASGSDMKTVSEILGHSDLTITGNIYASVYEDAKDAAVEAVSVLVPRKAV